MQTTGSSLEALANCVAKLGAQNRGLNKVETAALIIVVATVLMDVTEKSHHQGSALLDITHLIPTAVWNLSNPQIALPRISEDNRLTALIGFTVAHLPTTRELFLGNPLRQRNPFSDEYFTVDGTLLEASVQRERNKKTKSKPNATGRRRMNRAGRKSGEVA